MKKKRFIFVVALLGLLTSCGNAMLPMPYSEDELDDVVNDFSDVTWTDYTIPATSVTFAEGEQDVVINKGETHVYDVSIAPSDATKASLEWTSSNPSVATIDRGILTAVSEGECVIKVSSPFDLFPDVFLGVEVVVPITSFTISPEGTLECDINSEYTFTPTFTPNDTTFKELNWYIDEEDADIATVSNGVVTTHGGEGSVELVVTSDYIPNYSKIITLNVQDRTTHVTSITVNGPTSVELNKQITLTAEVLPSDADALAGGIKYYSRNPSVATVDENTGVVTGVSKGTAAIYAVCELTSNDYEVEVYEINADEVAFTEAGPIELSNGDTHQLEWVFKNNGQVVTPTDNTVTFESSNRDVVTVSANGLISVVAKGTANIIVKHVDSVNGNLSDTITVNVTIVSTGISIVGAATLYNDAEIVLTVSITPSGVSDDTVTYIASPSSLVDLTPNGLNCTVAAKGENGTVTITASNGSVSKTHTISIVDRPVEFLDGDMYIVGSAGYNTGTSTPVDGGSWLNAKYAYHFTEECHDPDPDMEIQYKGTIIFNQYDEWRYVHGGVGNSEIWIPGYEGDGPNYHIENAGAMTDGSMGYAEVGNPECNIVVNEAGSYDLYAKRYVSGWYALYIEKTPTLSVENTNVILNLGDTSTIVAHNYTGALSYASGDTNVATVSSAGVISAVAAGTTTVTVSDALDSVIVQVTVSEQTFNTIYLNANGIFDEAGAVPFIHSFDSSAPSDSQDSVMTLVTGQTIVYSASIPANHDQVVFVRMPGGSTSIDWDNKWNQSDDLVYGEYDMWTANGYNENIALGTWSTFDPNTTYVPAGGEVTTKNISIVSNETYSTDGAWFAVWAWQAGGEGDFYYGAAENYVTTIEVPNECNCYIVFRMSGLVTPESIFGFPSDSQWCNKTGDMENILGTTFTITGWVGLDGIEGIWS